MSAYGFKSAGRSGIYAIVNRTNGKRYVGSSAKVRARWVRHVEDLTAGSHHARALQRAWNKYGHESFEFLMLEEVEADRLIEREQFHIDAKADYNSSPRAASLRGMKQSEETKAKLRAHHAKNGHPMQGRKHTAEARALMSLQRTGRKQKPMSAEGRANIAAAARGRVISAEQRAKISAKLKGVKHTPERAKKAGDAHRGLKYNRSTNAD